METSKSSIGVELEFVIGVMTAGQELPVPKMFENSPGAPIILPPGVSGNSFGAYTAVKARTSRTIAKAIAKHRGERVVQSEEEALSDPNSIHLRYFSEWYSGTDSSVFIDDQEAFMGYYHWKPVEIASPALWATEESWEEIRAVVQALRDEYWIATPPTAGMHYHYGNGKDYIPFVNLRRIAALLVAADPMLVQLHPEHRRANEYCLSNRLYSRVAHGVQAATTASEIGVEYVEAEPESPSNRPQPNPIARPLRRRTPNLLVHFKRGELTGYKFDDEFTHFFTNSDFDYEDIRGLNQRPIEIPYAVREILRCTNAPTVAELMRYNPIITDRPAYAFKAYTHELYKKVEFEDGSYDHEYQHKRTIEFRQMASTMDPDEVVAHGKIVVRLCEIAAQLDIEELYKIVLDISVGESNGSWFDVFDFLAEIGMESEAKVLQYSVARFRGETIPEQIVDDQEQADPEQAEAVKEIAGRRLSGFQWLNYIVV
ncbi:hypothetical protein F4859DRAFT_527139 [Xylaria cf. heliscus]|nr:hypothetical protein F4859DRAFT_527139 [Xylaria cf. heliscus]